MTAILDIMRNRIENHNQYGVGEPSIQKFGSDRLVIELAGVSDVSKAKEYIQRTAEFELTWFIVFRSLMKLFLKLITMVTINLNYRICYLHLVAVCLLYKKTTIPLIRF